MVPEGIPGGFAKRGGGGLAGKFCRIAAPILKKFAGRLSGIACKYGPESHRKLGGWGIVGLGVLARAYMRVYLCKFLYLEFDNLANACIMLVMR